MVGNRFLLLLAFVLLYIATVEGTWNFNKNNNKNKNNRNKNKNKNKFNKDDDDDKHDKFDNLFNFGVGYNRITCFGNDFSYDLHKDDDWDNELDVCTHALIGGLILLVVAVPFALYFGSDYGGLGSGSGYGYGYGGSSYGGGYGLPHRRNDLPQVDPYVNPYETVESPEGYAAVRQAPSSFGEKLTSAFGNLATTFKRIGEVQEQVEKEA